jgi:WD40 repeat protein
VIVSGSWDHTVRVWDLVTGELVLDPLTGHDAGVIAVAVGEWQGRPMVASGGATGGLDGVRVWDLDSAPHAALRIGLQDPVPSVAFTANGLVIGTPAGLLQVDLL